MEIRRPGHNRAPDRARRKERPFPTLPAPRLSLSAGYFSVKNIDEIADVNAIFDLALNRG